jgi:hypothetical protein
LTLTLGLVGGLTLTLGLVGGLTLTLGLTLAALALSAVSLENLRLGCKARLAKPALFPVFRLR